MTEKRQPKTWSAPETVTPQFVVKSQTNVEHLLDALNREQSGLWLEEDSLEPKVLENPIQWIGIDFPERLAVLVTELKTLLARMAEMDPNTAAYFNAVMRPLMEIQKEFEGVRLYPEIHLGEDRRSFAVSYGLAIDSSDIFEHSALLGVLDLARAGELNRLRRCICGRWYKATRADQQFHAPKCRQLKYSQSPDFNAKRRQRYREDKDRKKRQQEARKQSHKR